MPAFDWIPPKHSVINVSKCPMTETGGMLTGACCGGIVDVRAWDNSLIASDTKCNTRQSSRARKDITSLRCTVGSTGDHGVVGLDSCGWEIQQGGTSVGNGVNRGRDETSRANGIAIPCEFPKAIRGVHSDVRDAASVFGSINVAKVVVSSRTFLQVCSEEGSSKSGYSIFKECRHLVWARCVDAVERKAKQPIACGIALEF